ncbi:MULTISPECIES: hypothetical protein [unclassified Rathayibacter]|uniref:hypothetical protein n=1 Tax=unclassified Rathayibacter TaxID=2609250 RepID=UPI0011B0EA74|nr:MULTISPECIES: hypothetical protein [unclassified Rathayibacter]
MSEVVSSTTDKMLEHLHARLDTHFSAIRDGRAVLEVSAPVFALEHEFSPEDRDLLIATVRRAVSKGLGSRQRRWWLPFVVYAAEAGYDYVGDEYWRSFEQRTPGWRTEHRALIKSWFTKFAAAYGGAVPTGAFAETFAIIAWPITHGVLPTYLQRQLAQLLYEFSGALTSDLLDDPPTLGLRLARRAASYTERFRIFCENTTLVGQVAAALLSGHDAPSPYLLNSTLERILADLSKEQQARRWLRTAQQSAHRARGFLPTATQGQTASVPHASTRATDPRLYLRFEDQWNAYAELPDLTPLGAGLPDVFRQLRVSRGFVNGADRHVSPSRLLYPGQSVRFAAWPRTDQAFLRLDRAQEETNRILADQCVITPGPWWLFRRQGAGLAIEVKGKSVRPGHGYLLIGAGSLTPPTVPWVTEVGVSVEGVRGYELTVPEQVSEKDAAALTAGGLAVITNVAIRPVGIVASAWDGEGEAEWIAGEPAILGIRSELVPRRCRLTIGGDVYFLEWPAEEAELLFSVQGLGVGTHVASVALLGNDDRPMTVGSLVITIRDPQIRPEGAAAGEGIRMLATPARPTLTELWDERAHIVIDGPAGAEADIEVRLRGERGQRIADLRRPVRLPLDEEAWISLARAIRKDRRFNDAYDDAESCVITVARAGVGFATLTCERGFQPLRWRFTRGHDGQVYARLVDRTDGDATIIEFYDVELPTAAVPQPVGDEIIAPSRGGLVVAHAGDASASLILPTEPNALLQQPALRPAVPTAGRTPADVRLLIDAHARWLNAELPADAFVAYQQQVIGKAIARAIGTIIGGSHWAAIERKVAHAQDVASLLAEMQQAVGISASHKDLAATIAYSLYKWLSARALLLGFDTIIAPHLASTGLGDHPAMSRFLLMLAGRPGHIPQWPEDEVIFLLERVMQTPVLYRAARFAVLGTRALNDADGVGQSF